MRNLKRLSLTDDDPTMTTTNIENSPSDVENGKNYFLIFYLFYLNFYLDDEQNNQ